jgi:cell wall-associated NlpC family hydrolase
MATDPFAGRSANTTLSFQTAPTEPVASEVAEPPASQPVAAAPSLRTYVVEPGDTLKALAERFGVSVATIAAANKLTDPDRIAVGQELLVLPLTGTLHRINPGETLGQVAARYGVESSVLAGANQLQDQAEQPIAGEQLVIPGVEPVLQVTKPTVKTAVAQAETKQASTETTATASGSREEPERVFASLTGTPEGEGGSVSASTVSSASPAAGEVEKPVARNRSPVTYDVQDGDNIASLANQFGVSIKTILLANNLDDPDLITVGTRLRVLPVSGVEHEVGQGESLADIAAAYKVDLGPIIDFNGLANPDVIGVGDKILIPGATARAAIPSPVQAAPAIQAAPAAKPAPAAPPAARVAPNSPASAVAALPAAKPAAAAPKPAIATKPASPAIPAPPIVGGGGAGIARNAMNFVGSRYVFGGASPAGFDCSGFVWYVHKISGIETSRGMWGQLNGGQRVSRDQLQPGDTVFFANTYMPGLSHDGIYLGGGQFVHAIDEGSGVGISSLSSSYWASRFIGATRIR